METIYEGPKKPAPAPDTIKSAMQSKGEWVKKLTDEVLPVAEQNLPQRTGPAALNNDLDGVFSGDEDGLWRATRALKKARAAASGQWATTDGYDPDAPIVERKYKKDRDEPLSLREASRDYSFTRKMEGAQELIDRYQLNGEQAYEAGRATNLPEPAPDPVWMIDGRGNLQEPLGDRRITDADALSPHEAAKQVGNFR